MPADSRPTIAFLVDENVPHSVAEFLTNRGHSVTFVQKVLPNGTPDPVVAAIGDRLSAVVVSWDKDFDNLASRIPQGNKAKFRRLGRLSFRCAYPNGVIQLQRWIGYIEMHYVNCRENPDLRMFAEIQENGIKMF